MKALFPGAERNPRRAVAALQLSRRLALRPDSQRPSVTGEPPLEDQLARRLRGFGILGILSILLILGRNLLFVP